MGGTKGESQMLIRQGDVMLERVDMDLPTEAVRVPREAGRVVLAHGEATGHAHAFDEADVVQYEMPETRERFVVIPGGKGRELRHEEHSFLKVPPGTYRVRRQREYSPEEIRRVAD